ncbi:MAG: helix-turn-helix domain-containing protein [Lachnospiraceae bacterium]|nr:helix-turn-helix domain-containing protein [Lachnospiraceae bacterium]
MAVNFQEISKADSNYNPETREKKTYSVQEIAEILEISRSKAYELCQHADFKVIRLGRIIRISKASFDSWFDSLL